MILSSDVNDLVFVQAGKSSKASGEALLLAPKSGKASGEALPPAPKPKRRGRKPAPYQGGAYALGGVMKPWKPTSNTLTGWRTFRDRIVRNLDGANALAATGNVWAARTVDFLRGELARVEAEIATRQPVTSAA